MFNIKKHIWCVYKEIVRDFTRDTILSIRHFYNCAVWFADANVHSVLRIDLNYQYLYLTNILLTLIYKSNLNKKWVILFKTSINNLDTLL